ncbi:hypothetical protein HDU93_006812, partial [Gonapodya sp. JEL0774]
MQTLSHLRWKLQRQIRRTFVRSPSSRFCQLPVEIILSILHYFPNFRLGLPVGAITRDLLPVLLSPDLVASRAIRKFGVPQLALVMECKRNPPDRPVIEAIIDCCGKKWHQSIDRYRPRLIIEWKKTLDGLMDSGRCWDILPPLFSAKIIIPDQVKLYITHEAVLSPKSEDVLKAILSVIRINPPVDLEDHKLLWRGLQFSCLYENKYTGAAQLILDAMLQRHVSLSDFSFRDSMFDIFASLAKDYTVYRERVVLSRSVSLKDREMFEKHHDSFPTFTHLFLTRNVIYAKQTIHFFPLNRI